MGQTLLSETEAEGTNLSVDTERICSYFHVFIPIPEMAWTFILSCVKNKSGMYSTVLRATALSWSMLESVIILEYILFLLW